MLNAHRDSITKDQPQPTQPLPTTTTTTSAAVQPAQAPGTAASRASKFKPHAQRLARKATTREGWLGQYDYAWLCLPTLPFSNSKSKSKSERRRRLPHRRQVVSRVPPHRRGRRAAGRHHRRRGYAVDQDAGSTGATAARRRIRHAAMVHWTRPRGAGSRLPRRAQSHAFRR